VREARCTRGREPLVAVAEATVSIELEGSELNVGNHQLGECQHADRVHFLPNTNLVKRHEPYARQWGMAIGRQWRTSRLHRKAVGRLQIAGRHLKARAA
jgi:hypothetical protein